MATATAATTLLLIVFSSLMTSSMAFQAATFGGSRISYNNRNLITTSAPSSSSSTRLFIFGASSPASSPSASNTKKTTLTEETAWKLRFLLKGLPTEQGKRVDEIFTINVQFIEESGYEPPQGYLQQLQQTDGEDKGDEKPRLQVVKSRWQLSEDPNERKDSLWVWGLFEEPLYPFMLLQLETNRIVLPGGGSSSDDGDDESGNKQQQDAIKPIKLFAQLNHKRDKEVGVILDGGDLNVRQMETVNADPFGAAKVDIYEEVSVGNISIQPILQ